MKATIEDIRRLAERIENSWSLCELFKGTRRACKAQVMVTQTIHASVINHDKHGETFSFRGDGVFTRGGGGLTDNGYAYRTLLEREYFTEEERGDKTVIFVTQKLVDYLDTFFARKAVPEAAL